jgi:hypothetical protein
MLGIDDQADAVEPLPPIPHMPATPERQQFAATCLPGFVWRLVQGHLQVAYPTSCLLSLNAGPFLSSRIARAQKNGSGQRCFRLTQLVQNPHPPQLCGGVGATDFVKFLLFSRENRLMCPAELLAWFLSSCTAN